MRKKEYMKRITVTISESAAVKLEKLEEISKWSKSLIVRESLRDFLERYEAVLESKE